MAKGEPGCGKTVGIASWAKEGPMYFFDLDHRLAPLKKMYRKNEEILNNCFVINDCLFCSCYDPHWL